MNNSKLDNKILTVMTIKTFHITYKNINILLQRLHFKCGHFLPAKLLPTKSLYE